MEVILAQIFKTINYQGGGNSTKNSNFPMPARHTTTECTKLLSKTAKMIQQ